MCNQHPNRGLPDFPVDFSQRGTAGRTPLLPPWIFQIELTTTACLTQSHPVPAANFPPESVYPSKNSNYWLLFSVFLLGSAVSRLYYSHIKLDTFATNINNLYFQRLTEYIVQFYFNVVLERTRRIVGSHFQLPLPAAFAHLSSGRQLGSN